MSKSFGDDLKRMRLRAGYSQRDIANVFGYATPQFISNWERNASFPPTEIIKTLAYLYGENPDNLFYEICEAKVDSLKYKERASFNESKVIKHK